MATKIQTGEIEPFGDHHGVPDREVLPRHQEAAGARLQQPEHHEEQPGRRAQPARRAFAPVLAASGGGAIVNMLSVTSFYTNPLDASYGASKAAVKGGS
jgi:hypothetical protein